MGANSGMTEARAFATVAGHRENQARTCDSALGAFDWACGAMAIPSCSIIDIRFQFAHSSTIFEPSMRKMEVPVTLAFLLVGGMPRNWPLWVPVPVQWITTSFRSAMVSSIVNVRSGKPLRHVWMWFLRVSAPAVREGNTGTWERQS